MCVCLYVCVCVCMLGGRRKKNQAREKSNGNRRAIITHNTQARPGGQLETE